MVKWYPYEGTFVSLNLLIYTAVSVHFTGWSLLRHFIISRRVWNIKLKEVWVWICTETPEQIHYSSISIHNIR